jgi:hypothetical protein
MIWILHDHSRRAVIAPFSTREEAEAWRDRNGLAGLMSVSAERTADEPPARDRRTAECTSGRIRLQRATPASRRGSRC